MNRVQGYKQMNSRPKAKIPWTLAVIVAGILIFVVAFIWFRGGGEESAQQTETTEPVELRTENIPSVPVEEPETISLIDVTGGESTGIATRVIDDGVYKHTVKATIPDLEEGYFYEGWLVSQSPFHFFSTGDMVTISTGEYVLEWYGEFGETYSGYTDVVITIEPDDGDPAPADHILEGSF